MTLTWLWRSFVPLSTAFLQFIEVCRFSFSFPVWSKLQLTTSRMILKSLGLRGSPWSTQRLQGAQVLWLQNKPKSSHLHCCVDLVLLLLCFLFSPNLVHSGSTFSFWAHRGGNRYSLATLQNKSYLLNLSGGLSVQAFNSPNRQNFCFYRSDDTDGLIIRSI